MYVRKRVFEHGCVLELSLFALFMALFKIRRCGAMKYKYPHISETVGVF